MNPTLIPFAALLPAPLAPLHAARTGTQCLHPCFMAMPLRRKRVARRGQSQLGDSCRLRMHSLSFE
jgi:hypothetical protein